MKIRKVGINDLPSKVHWHQCCARTAAQNYRQNMLQSHEKIDILKGCSGFSVYLWCWWPLPPHLPIQCLFLQLSGKETLKAKWHETSCIYVFEQTAVKGDDHDKSRNPRSTVQSSFLQLFEKETFQQNMMGKVGVHNLTIQSSELKVFCVESCTGQ